MKTFARLSAALCAVLGLLAVAQPASAQQPTAAAIDSAKKILTIKNAEAMYRPVLVGVVEQAKVTLTQANLNLQQPLQEVATQLVKEFSNRGDEVANELARRYAVAFTEQELKDLVAFYSSPLGRKTVEKEPTILQESVIFMEEWANKLSEQVITRFRQEMKKRGHDI